MRSPAKCSTVSVPYSAICSAQKTNDDLQELAKEIMPMMSEHENNISLNERAVLHASKAVYEQQDKETLNPEQHKLLEDIYNGFVRNGANLQGEAKEKYRALCKELSLLTLQFSENNLKENERLQACHHRQVTTGRATRERGRSRCRDSRGKRRRKAGYSPCSSPAMALS